MARITESQVYKNNAPRIKSISRRQFAKELGIVKKGYNFRVYDNNGCYEQRGVHWDRNGLSESFVWSCTPQGFDFWYNLHMEVINHD